MNMLKESPSNYYNILGCNNDSSQEDIKRAYHKQALLFHPDKNNDLTDNTDKFQQIDKAWRILRDPELRKEYDAECKQMELEARSILIYERISWKELETTESEDILTYRCRCSGNYFVCKKDLEEKNIEIYIPCQECTFVVIIET